MFDQAGHPCTVVAVCHRQPEPLFHVTFEDKSYLVAGGQQPLVTASHSLRHKTHKGNFAIRDWAWDFAPPTTLDVREFLIYQRESLAEAMHSVPLAMPLILPDQDPLIDPYLLGLWPGDGSSGGPVITCHRDDEGHYRQRALEAGENWRIINDRNGVLTCSLAHGPHRLLVTRLRELGVLNDKHIPAVYLRASTDQRLELMRGLMDSDGCVDPMAGQAEYTYISESLSRGVLELALTLGQKATRKKGEAKLNGVRTSDKWRVTFTPTLLVFLAKSEGRRAQKVPGTPKECDSPQGSATVHPLRRAGGGEPDCLRCRRFSRQYVPRG